VEIAREIRGDVSIIQFNYRQANYNTLRLIFNALELAKRLVLVIQEPAFNKHTGLTYYPRGFKLVYKANPVTRVYFMVSEILGTGQ